MYYADVSAGIVDLGERIIRPGERPEQWRGGDSCLWGSPRNIVLFPFFLFLVCPFASLFLRPENAFAA